MEAQSNMGEFKCRQCDAVRKCSTSRSYYRFEGLNLEGPLCEECVVDLITVERRARDDGR
jgi:hypothetical protein